MKRLFIPICLGSILAFAPSLPSAVSQYEWAPDVKLLADNTKYSSAMSHLRSHLQSQPPEGLIDALRDVLKSSPHPNARIRAALLLGVHKADRSRQSLEEALLSDPSFFVRRLIPFALKPYGQSALPALKKGLIDPDPGVRGESLETMAQIGGPAIPIVLSYLNKELSEEEPSTPFLLGAIGSLSGIQDQRVAAFFLRHLSHSNKDVRADLAGGLGYLAWDPTRLPPPGEPTPLINLAPVEKAYQLTDQDRQALRAALETALSDPDEEVRKQAQKSMRILRE